MPHVTIILLRKVQIILIFTAPPFVVQGNVHSCNYKYRAGFFSNGLPLTVYDREMYAAIINNVEQLSFRTVYVCSFGTGNKVTSFSYH